MSRDFDSKRAEENRRLLWLRTRGIRPGKEFAFGKLPAEVKVVSAKDVKRGVAVGL